MFEDDETPIFGRTDLRKGVSEAKFDAEADFDVKKCLTPPKNHENHEKPKKIAKKISEKNFRRQKIESCKSSETRFPEVSRRSERSSRGERKIFCRATRRLNRIDGGKRNAAISWFMLHRAMVSTGSGSQQNFYITPQKLTASSCVCLYFVSDFAFAACKLFRLFVRLFVRQSFVVRSPRSSVDA